MSKKFLFILLCLLSLGLFFTNLLPASSTQQSYKDLEGSITQIDAKTLTLHVNRGDESGKEITVSKDTSTLLDEDYKIGDEIVIQNWSPTTGELSYVLADYVRRPVLYELFALFMIVVLLVTGWQGIRALLGLGFSFLVLFKLIFPLMILGWDPLWTAILGCILMIPAMFYLTHGLNRKTSAAVVGTFCALVISGLIANWFAQTGHLSGLSDETAGYLKSQFGDFLNFQKLLLAGILISMLGVMDDVSISQASVVQEIKNHKRTLSFFELYKSAMKVGKDHIGSMVNTLVLVYAGASLPMLIVFLVDGYGVQSVLNYEFVASQIIQTFAASIGLILTVPLTTAVAALTVQSKK